MPTLPRGVRSNNPGNIRVGSPWQGLMPPEQMTPEQRAEKEFCVFAAPKWGIRACARTLITYQDVHGLNTVEGIINRWAPPSENQTMHYIDAVERKVGKGEINVHEFDTMNNLVRAIIHHENGSQPYTNAQITAGLVLAGVEPPQHDSLRGSGTVKGGQVAGLTQAATTATGIAAAAAPAIPFLDWLRDNLWLLAVVGVVGLGATGYMLWRRYDDRRKLLR